MVSDVEGGCRVAHAAVDDEFGTEHESGLGRGQVKDRGGDLFRRAEAFERDLALNPVLHFLEFFRGAVAQKVRRDGARADHIQPMPF